MIVVLSIFGQNEIIDCELGQAMLVLVWLSWQGSKQFVAERCCPLRGVEVEEFRTLCLVLQVVRVTSQLVREHD